MAKNDYGGPEIDYDKLHATSRLIATLQERCDRQERELRELKEAFDHHREIFYRNFPNIKAA